MRKFFALFIVIVSFITASSLATAEALPSTYEYELSRGSVLVAQSPQVGVWWNEDEREITAHSFMEGKIYQFGNVKEFQSLTNIAVFVKDNSDEATIISLCSPWREALELTSIGNANLLHLGELFCVYQDNLTNDVFIHFYIENGMGIDISLDIEYDELAFPFCSLAVKQGDEWYQLNFEETFNSNIFTLIEEPLNFEDLIFDATNP